MIEVALGVLVAATATAFLADDIRAHVLRRPRLFRPLLGRQARLRAVVTSSIAAAVLVVPAAIPSARRGLFAFCGVCPIAGIGQAAAVSFPDAVRDFLLASWYYAATVVPVFVLACLLSGLMIARERRFRVRGVLPSFGLAAVLPVCSCGIVPLADVMLRRKGRGARDGLILLAVAPLLSPTVILLGLSLLGPRYVVLRILGSVLVAAATVWVVRPLLAGPIRRGGKESSCGGLSVCAGGATGSHECGDGDRGEGGEASVLLASWSVLVRLLRYVFYGVVLGAAFIAVLPAEYVARIVRGGIAALAGTAVIGVPVNMCGGADVLLLAPLVGMGLPMGHALTFSLASTGICIASLPLLVAVVGKRATAGLVMIYLAVPVVFGWLVNLLPPAVTAGPAPF